jgi:hypothetical protein
MGTTTSPPSSAQAPAKPSPAPDTQRSSETYTPPSPKPYSQPSNDEPGPVEEEDDIPREDNDTSRE